MKPQTDLIERHIYNDEGEHKANSLLLKNVAPTLTPREITRNNFELILEEIDGLSWIPQDHQTTNSHIETEYTITELGTNSSYKLWISQDMNYFDEEYIDFDPKLPKEIKWDISLAIFDHVLENRDNLAEINFGQIDPLNSHKASQTGRLIQDATPIQMEQFFINNRDALDELVDTVTEIEKYDFDGLAEAMNDYRKTVVQLTDELR